MRRKTGIALFVYNRPYHTMQVLEGLKRNKISKMYIFSDGAKNEMDSSEVKEVRKLIKKIDWCETEVHISFENKGLAKSIVEGINYILNRYDRIIVLEDDCVPSSDFITFMEKCFDKYGGLEDVMSVSGFSPPVEVPVNYKYDIYFSYRFSCWGWGTWKRAWKSFEKDNNLREKINKSRAFRKRVFVAGKDLVPMLEKQCNGECDSWAVFFALNIIDNEGFCINPVQSRIKNIGFDGSGIHSKLTDKFNVSLHGGASEKLSLPEDIIINKRIIKSFRSFYVPTITKEIKAKIKQILKFLRLFKSLKKIKHKIIRGSK